MLPFVLFPLAVAILAMVLVGVGTALAAVMPETPRGRR